MLLLCQLSSYLSYLFFFSGDSQLTSVLNQVTEYLCLSFLFNKSRRPSELYNLSTAEFDNAKPFGDGQLDVTLTKHKTGKKKAAKLILDADVAAICTSFRNILGKLTSPPEYLLPRLSVKNGFVKNMTQYYYINKYLKNKNLQPFTSSILRIITETAANLTGDVTLMSLVQSGLNHSKPTVTKYYVVPTLEKAQKEDAAINVVKTTERVRNMIKKGTFPVNIFDGTMSAEEFKIFVVENWKIKDDYHSKIYDTYVDKWLDLAKPVMVTFLNGKLKDKDLTLEAAETLLQNHEDFNKIKRSVLAALAKD